MQIDGFDKNDRAINQYEPNKKRAKATHSSLKALDAFKKHTFPGPTSME